MVKFSCLFEHGSIQNSGEPNQVRNVKAYKRHAQLVKIPNKRPGYDHPEDIESLSPQPSKSNGRL